MGLVVVGVVVLMRRNCFLQEETEGTEENLILQNFTTDCTDIHGLKFDPGSGAAWDWI
jgi:hypothetical protein